MITFKVSNLRSLVNTPEIEIKPITILLGSNSSGKSTFLRTLPLLKQSLIRRKRSPLLWFGDLVDFGSFDEALYSGNTDPVIKLGFRFPYSEGRETNEEEFYYDDEFRPLGSYIADIFAEISIREHKPEKRGYVSEVSLSVNREDRVTINADPNGSVSKIIYNDIEIGETKGLFLSMSGQALVPQLNRFEERVITKSDGTKEPVRFFANGGAFAGKLTQLLSGYFSHKTAKSKIEEIGNLLSYGNTTEIIKQLRSAGGALKVLQKRVERLVAHPTEAQEIRKFVILNSVPRWLAAADAYARKTAESVRYIAPIRASAQRYYRTKELSIEEIDPHGENLPAFLQSLLPKEQARLNEWMRENFGFTIEAESIGGHIRLKYRGSQTDGNAFNLADMGFGYSQLLPIIIQMWAAEAGFIRPGVRAPTRQARMFAIEQPELHLHPRLQASLIEVIARTVAHPNKSKPFSYLLETHSESIINQLGTLIRTQTLSPETISILIFNKDESTGQTTVNKSTFDQDGLLENWPYGFFSAD